MSGTLGNQGFFLYLDIKNAVRKGRLFVFLGTIRGLNFLY